MNILCTLKNLNLSFGTKVLFQECSLILYNKDKVGLLGLNGCGKSSLFKILKGEISADISSPPFIFDKASKDGDEKKTFTVFLVPQEISNITNRNMTIKNFVYEFHPELKRFSIKLREINEQLEQASSKKDQYDRLILQQKEILESIERINGWEIVRSYESYLKLFGISELDQSICDLSGGQQKKILLSLGFSCGDNLVLWDEPTNHLDIETIKIFENELLGLDKAYIIISHDRYLLSRVTNKIFHVKNRDIIQYNGNLTDYFEHLQEEREKHQKLILKLKNNLRRETDWMNQGIKARGTRSKKRVENYHELKNCIQDLKSETHKSLELSFSNSERKTKKLVHFKNVDFGYDKKTSLLKNLSLSIYKNDRIGLLGKNGVGKSTLVKLIAGELKPSDGTLSLAQNLVVQNFSQKREKLSEDKSPYEIIGDGQDFINLPDGRTKHIHSYLESFLFSRDEIHRPLKTFSGGEKNRLQMAINLKQAGDLWIFDEPTNDLDLESLEILEKNLIEFNGSIILISHDRAFLDAVTNKIWLLDNGELQIFEGGHGQVAPYLEALELEKNLEAEKREEIDKDQGHESNEKKTTKQNKGLTNKEKIRLKIIDQDISKWEEKLEEHEKKLAEFDFTEMDTELAKEYGVLCSLRDETEEKLMGFYEEKEELTLKLNV